MSDQPKNQDQRLLLAAAQAGDERAFRRLVHPYRHALEVHCYRMLGSAQEAEDLVQETLLRAWRALERFEPRAQLQTWLYRIATNACLDELERRPRRPEPIDPFPDVPIDETAAPTFDPVARYAIREGMELALLRAIQELPGRQRAVLIFRDVLGWTSPEVAELLESTVASVNSALQRARATIDGRLPATPPSMPGPAERELLGRYVDVFERDDVDGLVALLREDALLRMPPQPSVLGALRIARFFREVAGGGDLTRFSLTPIRANGRPAVAIYRRSDDGGLIPHGISVLEMEGDRIVGIETFVDPTLLPRFGFPAENPATPDEYNARIIDEFRASRGRVGGPWEGTPLLLLHHVGATSGLTRVNPLGYLPQDGRYVVFASNGGARRNPGWFHNLKAQPNTRIEVGGETIAVLAVEATGEERERLFELGAARFPQLHEHAAKTDRVIPVIVIAPRAGA